MNKFQKFITRLLDSAVLICAFAILMSNIVSLCMNYGWWGILWTILYAIIASIVFIGLVIVVAYSKYIQTNKKLTGFFKYLTNKTDNKEDN